MKPGDEQLDQDQLLQTKPQSGNVAGAIDRTGEMEEKSETNESVPTKDIHVAKKRRGAPKARAKASAGKKSATAEGAANGVLEPDEEYTTLANSAAKSRKFVGAHISAAGGVHNAPLSCFNVKGKRSVSCSVWTNHCNLPSNVLLPSHFLKRVQLIVWVDSERT